MRLDAKAGGGGCALGTHSIAIIVSHVDICRQKTVGWQCFLCEGAVARVQVDVVVQVVLGVPTLTHDDDVEET